MGEMSREEFLRKREVLRAARVPERTKEEMDGLRARYFAAKDEFAERWFGGKNGANFTANFGPVREGRVDDPAFVAEVREVLAAELELEIADEYGRLLSPDVDVVNEAIQTIRSNGKVDGRGPHFRDKLVRICQDLRLDHDEIARLKNDILALE